MRYIKKLSIIFVIAVFSLAVPVIANAYSGTQYDDYLYYQINSDQTGVTITDCDSSATEVVIPNEIENLPVTSIGSYAFYGCSGLTSVNIPDSVTSIGYQAFYDCSGLTSVTIPDSVTSIGAYAFYSCSGLASITIPDSVTSIGAYAFYSCSGLASITIPDSVTSIGSSAFYSCSGLASITIPDSVTSIGSSAFYYCSSLDSVYISDLTAYLNIEFGSSDANPMYYADKLYLNGKRVSGNLQIPEGITKIPYCAFDGCDGIKSVTIPDSVTSIDSSAFSRCSGLSSVTIPDSVTSIGNNAFYNCNGLKDVHITDIAKWCEIEFGGSESTPMYYATNLYVNDVLTTGLVIPNGVTKISKYAFYGCGGLTSISIPDSVTSIGGDAFYNCKNLQDVYITDIAKWCEIVFGVTNNRIASNPFYYADNLYVNDVLTTDLVIPNGVTSIGYDAFGSCDSLTSVTIPDSVTTIDGHAFGNCDNLINITIPDSVTTIGDYAFSGCESLTDVTIGNGLETIGEYAFQNCSGLSSVNYNASKVFSNIFGESSYYYSNNILLIVLGDNVKSIDTNAFSDCDNLKRIIIPKSVTEIEKAAFKDCTSLSTVEYGGSKADWEEIYIGTENENLENANIIFNSSLSNTTLTDLDYLTYTVNEDNTVTITNCYENATSINIPKEIDGKPVTAINASAFANRSKLTSVTIPESVTSIGERAFNGCSSLTDIVIPDGVTAIESNTFYNCSKLKNVTIPKSVTAIKSYAFYGCGSLTDTYYSGSDADFGNIKIDYGNEQLTKSNIHYSGTTPTPTPELTPLPVTTAEITKAETADAYTFTVTPEKAYENCFVYAAVYDANGALIALDRMPLAMTGSTSVSVNKQENGVTAKVFVWSDFMQSIIEHAEEFTLTR